jgi:hypothetical protein
VSHDDAGPYWLACAVAILALLILAAGSVLVGGLWITPQTGDLGTQAQSDAASYGTGLFWPLTIVLACLCGSGALALVRTRKRTLLALNGSALALIIGPYVALAQTSILASAPLQGIAEWMLIGLLLIINLGAIGGAWRYVLRRKPPQPVGVPLARQTRR